MTKGRVSVASCPAESQQIAYMGTTLARRAAVTLILLGQVLLCSQRGCRHVSCWKTFLPPLISHSLEVWVPPEPSTTPPLQRAGSPERRAPSWVMGPLLTAIDSILSLITSVVLFLLGSVSTGTAFPQTKCWGLKQGRKRWTDCPAMRLHTWDGWSDGQTDG